MKFAFLSRDKTFQRNKRSWSFAFFYCGRVREGAAAVVQFHFFANGAATDVIALFFPEETIEDPHDESKGCAAAVTVQTSTCR